MKMRAVLFVLALAGGAATCQYWDFEQVSTDRASFVQLRLHPSGSLRLFYSPDGQGVRVAWKDSVWRFDDAGGTGRFDADIGRDGTLAVGYLLADGMMGCGIRSDTGWVHETLPWRCDGSQPRLAVGNRGESGIMFVTSDDTIPETALLLASRESEVWRLDTIWYHCGIPHSEFAAYRLAYDSRSRPLALCKDGYVSSSWREDLYVVAESGGARIHAGWENSLHRAVLGLDGQDAWGVLFSNTDCEGRNTLTYSDGRSGAIVDSLAEPWSVAFDTAYRPHVVYHRSGLVYRWCSGVEWPLFYVPRSGVRSAELTISGDCQPIIAFCDGLGVWLARGVGIVGVEEWTEPNAKCGRTSLAVCRGALRLQGDSRLGTGYRAGLFDISGRRVLDLTPGENDVGRVAPGLYCVAGENPRGLSPCRVLVLR